MINRSFKIFCAVVLVAASLAQACKKKEEEDNRKYMDGNIKIQFPSYVYPGYAKSFNIDTLMTLKRADGGQIGYFYRPVDGTKYDTLCNGMGTILKKEFTIVASDKIGSHTFAFGAFALADYYGTSISKTFTVVMPGFDEKGSITNFNAKPDDKKFTDGRDDKIYYYTTIDGVDWMRQNLAWEGAGVPFENCEPMSDIFGQYYNWTEAQTACPEGWRLPSDADWAKLAKKYNSSADVRTDIRSAAGQLMGDLYFNKTKMWEFWRDVKITNATTLSIMPVGYALISDGQPKFKSLYKYAALWTSDGTEDAGSFRYIYHDKDILYYGQAPKKDFAASVRCIR